MCDLVSFGCRSMDTMLQTVPSAGFSPPCDYSNFTAWFDLSLLPSPDSEVPDSPVNLQQVNSLYSDTITSPLSMFPAGGHDDLHGLKPATTTDTATTTTATTSIAAPTTTTTTTMVQCSTDPYHFPIPPIKEEPVHYTSRETCSYLSPYSMPMSSPFPPSPAGSTSSSSTYQRSGSPTIKPEQTIDIQEILQESRYLQESLKPKPKRSPSFSEERMLSPRPSGPVLKKEELAGPSSEGSSSAGDHRLLREVLRDTSFQRRYNLKPFDFAGLAPGFMTSEGPSRSTLPPPPQQSEAASTSTSAQPPEVKLEEGELQLSREKMEPVLSLAIEQLRKDVGDACNLLGISPDPSRWSVADVRSWVLWTLRQYGLPIFPLDYFEIDGPALINLSEQEFQQRAPQCGSTLYAQLEIWKAASQDLDIQWNTSSTSGSSSGDASEDEEDETEIPSTSSGAVGGKAPTSRPGSSSGTGGSHIHLWQFLKELLSAPQLHGSCIRWIDRSKGVFKIEDSVRVARLWGKRKNRPAMNYDKLSRSIRQYYKKGIMKKTERSQRLVYQFCHPYCL